MSKVEYKLLEDLVNKVDQHEKTIAQLVEIIAATNHRISDLSSKKEKYKHTFSPY